MKKSLFAIAALSFLAFGLSSAQAAMFQLGSMQFSDYDDCETYENLLNNIRDIKGMQVFESQCRDNSGGEGDSYLLKTKVFVSKESLPMSFYVGQFGKLTSSADNYVEPLINSLKLLSTKEVKVSSYATKGKDQLGIKKKVYLILK